MTGYELDCRGSIPGRDKRFFLPHSVQTDSRAHLASHSVGAVVSLGTKKPGRKTDHSPPFSAEVKNGGAIPPFPYFFMEWCLIN
jgi:hypothetical protein